MHHRSLLALQPGLHKCECYVHFSQCLDFGGLNKIVFEFIGGGGNILGVGGGSTFSANSFNCFV